MIYNLAKITDVATIVSGSTPIGIDDLYEDNGDIPFFRVSDMNSFGNEIWMTSSINNLSLENARKLKLKICDAGTIIFPKRGGAIFTNKKRILSKPSTYDLNTMGLIPNEKVQKKYFFYWFNSLDLSSLADGSSVPQLNNKQISPLQIPLPPLPVQQKIAAILDAADELRQKDKALLAKYEELTQALFLDMFGDPVSNPKGWEIKTIEEITTSGKSSIKRGPFGGALKKEIFVEDGYLVYEQFHALNNDFTMARYFIDENKFNELKGFEVRPRDIIISCSGVYLGKLAIIPEGAKKGIINQALLKITLDEQKMRNDFFVFHFTHKNFKEKHFDANRGAGIPNFPPMPTFKKFPFIAPPINLQNQFAERVKAIEDQKAIVQASAVKSEELFNSLLQKAFNGELVN